MLSLRSFSRSISRTLPGLTSPLSWRTLSTLSRPCLSQPVRIALKPSYAAFTTSRWVRASEGQVDQELSAKFESELQMEKEMRDSDELPPNVKGFFDSSSFQLHDTAGEEEVVLTRSFGDEKIRITFTIADLNTLDEDPDRYSEDKALFDEDGSNMPTDTQSGGAQTKGAINQGRTKGGNFNVATEDRIAPADRPELMDDESPETEEDQDPSFPARVNVTIEKPGKGAMQIETVAQDGMIVIENIYFFSKAELADAKTAELDYSKKSMYLGPPFGNLDEDLQVLLERYLDERGINTSLALMIPDYIDFKEQREYLNWLSNVKSFVDE